MYFANADDVQEVASCLSVTAKAEQIDIILKLSQGKDVLAKLPTGFGKSFLYQAFIIKIALKYPDLIKEIEFLTQDHYLENLSPGIKNSAKRIIEDVNSTK